MRIIIIVATIAVAVVAGPYVWRNYIVPQSAIGQDYAACALDADHLYGLERSRYFEEHHYLDLGLLNEIASNVDHCMTARGWAYLSTPGPMTGCLAFCYTPSGRVARWLYLGRV